jgi:hypothetical protein
MVCLHAKQPLPLGNNPIAVNKYKNNSVMLVNFRKSECVFVFKELIGMVAGKQTGCMVERAFRNKIFLAKYNKIQ